MKSGLVVVGALAIAALGFLGGWTARGDIHPTVTVEMGPLERTWFMPAGALAASKDACAVSAAFRIAEKEVPAAMKADCDREIDQQLSRALATPLLQPAKQ